MMQPFIRTIQSFLSGMLFPVLLLGGSGCLSGCSEESRLDNDTATLCLEPSIRTVGQPATRSIVNGTEATANADKINTAGLYLTYADKHTPYLQPSAQNVTYTYNGSSWSSANPFYLFRPQARIYAFSPASSVLTTDGTNGNHSISVDVPVGQTFNGSNAWQCSATDYLYGAANETVGDASSILANSTSGNPTIYLQHALSQIVFTLRTAQGRPVDETYDYVKHIRLTSSSGTPFLTGSGSMRIKDGSLVELTEAAQLSFTPTPVTSAVKVGTTSQTPTVAYGLVAPLSSQPSGLSVTVVLGKPSDSNGERELTATLPALNVQWLKGRRYTYNLVLGNRNITVESPEIGTWTEDSGSHDMKPDGFTN